MSLPRIARVAVATEHPSTPLSNATCVFALPRHAGKDVVAYARFSLVSIELLTVAARIVVSSVDTYLRFAEATNRLDLLEQGPPSLLDLVEEGAERTIEHVATNVVQNKVEGGLMELEEGAAKLGPVGEAVVSGAEKTVAKVAYTVIKDD
jgi:gas vesicle structural protein